MLGVVELADGVVRSASPAETAEEPEGVRVKRSAAFFELYRDRPGRRQVYYRVDYGRLEWGEALDEFSTGEGRLDPDPGWLLAMTHGLVPPPDVSPLPGVRRLALGTTVRVDASGVTVTQRPPTPSGRRQGLVEAVGALLTSLGKDYAIAYSGGLSSVFLAACALAAGHRPRLLHGELDPVTAARLPVPEIAGLDLRRVQVDLSELLDHHRITGAEPAPPLPDTELPSLLMTRLMSAGNTPIVSGLLLKEIVSAPLAAADTGIKGRRLLGAEPFHIAGRLRTLREARDLMSSGLVHSSGRHDHGPAGPDRAGEPDVQPIATPPPPTPVGGHGIPGLTEAGRTLLQSTRRSYQAVWNQHLGGLPSVLGRVEAGLLERGQPRVQPGRVILPALDPGVQAVVSALPPDRICGIRGGVFRNHLLLHKAVAACGVQGVAATSPGFRLRLCAATYLHRERSKVIAELSNECALADLGLIELPVVLGLLRNGPALAEHALPLLRLVWVDQWLRGR